MTNEEFEIELDHAILRSKKLLMKKRLEYSEESGDRLNQFYRAGTAQDILPTEALMGMATKHITSIADMVKNPEEYNLRKWNEKITALRNYTFLLDALIRDMGII